MMMERLVSLLMALGLGYIVLSSPYVNLEWAVIIAWFLVGTGAMVKICLYGIAKKGPAAPFEVLQMGGAGVNANSNWVSNCDSRASDGSSSFAC